mgnify:CR=1 FL=1
MMRVSLIQVKGFPYQRDGRDSSLKLVKLRLLKGIYSRLSFSYLSKALKNYCDEIKRISALAYLVRISCPIEQKYIANKQKSSVYFYYKKN